jgi:hypothetical protein
LPPIVHANIVIALLHPLSRTNVPSSASGIQRRTHELSFGTTFLREIHAITEAKKHVEHRLIPVGKLERQREALPRNGRGKGQPRMYA